MYCETLNLLGSGRKKNETENPATNLGLIQNNQLLSWQLTHTAIKTVADPD